MARTLMQARAGRREAVLSVEAVQSCLREIRGQLENARAMKRNLTSAQGSLDEVERLIEAAKAAILASVAELEELIVARREAA